MEERKEILNLTKPISFTESLMYSKRELANCKIVDRYLNPSTYYNNTSINNVVSDPIMANTIIYSPGQKYDNSKSVKIVYIYDKQIIFKIYGLPDQIDFLHSKIPICI